MFHELLYLLVTLALGIALGAVLRCASWRRNADAAAAAFERGRQTGLEEERQQLEVRVTPYKAVESEWLGLKSVLTVGYSQQIFYRGLPVGEPQTVVTRVEQSWDKERVDRVLELATDVATMHVGQLVKAGMRARLSR